MTGQTAKEILKNLFKDKIKGKKSKYIQAMAYELPQLLKTEKKAIAMLPFGCEVMILKIVE